MRALATAAAFLLAVSCALPKDPENRVMPSPLPLGRAALPLATGRYASPDGFIPRVTVAVGGGGWQSFHRYADFFDVMRPDPASPVPAVAVAFSRATETTPDAVMAAIRAAQPAAASAVRPGAIGQRPARVVDVVGGSGDVYRSGNLGLEAAPRQHLRIFAGAVLDVVLVVAVIVPDESEWPVQSVVADEVVRRVEFVFRQT